MVLSSIQCRLLCSADNQHRRFRSVQYKLSSFLSTVSCSCDSEQGLSFTLAVMMRPGGV